MGGEDETFSQRAPQRFYAAEDTCERRLPDDKRPIIMNRPCYTFALGLP